MNQVLPFDEQAENAVLSGLLIPSGDLIDDIISEISADHFWIKSNQVIFSAISELHKKSLKIDAITVSSYLKSCQQLDEVGGDFYVFKVATSNPLASHAIQYVEIVKEKWKLRKLIEISDHVQRKAYLSDDSKDLLSEMEGKLFSLSQDSTQEQNSLQSACQELNEILDSETQYGLETGIKTFDKITGGLLPGRYYGLGGRVKQGKTALACQMTLNMILRGIPGLYISLEMQRSEIIARMCCNLAEVDYSKVVRKTYNLEEKAKLKKANEIIKQKPLVLKVPATISAHEIRSEIRKAKRKFDIKFVVIDYIQKVKIEGGDVRISVSNASEAIRATCKETGVAAIVVCQLNREAEKERPRLGHLKESGAIEQDADVICLIFATDKEQDGFSARDITLAFDANRNGPQCDEQMLYEGRFLKFREKPPGLKLSK